MSFTGWNLNYSVGVQTLDRQHIGLFETLNELHEAVLAGDATATTGPVLRRLVEYTNEHFVAEETILAAAKYPGLASHRAQHRALTNEVNQYLARFEHGELSLSAHLVSFLRDWLSAHILKEDLEYGPWLAEHGVH
jgi:hemerythrin